MENFLYFDMDHAQRLEILRKTSISRENMTFKRSLSDQDLEDRKDAYTREQMRLATVKADFKEYKARKMADIKAIEKNQEDALDVIANGTVEVYDETFLIPDFNKGEIMFVDKHGEIVHRREMKADERQGRLALEDAAPIPTDPNEHIEDAHVVEITEAYMETEKPKEKEQEQEAPATNKRARGRKPKAAASISDVVSDIVEESQPNDAKGIYSGVEADPDAMERVKEMDNEN